MPMAMAGLMSMMNSQMMVNNGKIAMEMVTAIITYGQ